MTLRSLILDDELPATRVLERFVGQTPWLQLAQTFSDPVPALAYLESQPVDLLLLDIEMPGMSGLKLMEQLKDPPLVIFTTAYPDFALQGFELAAVDYLLKPIAYDRFLRAVTRALVLKRSAERQDQHLSFRADRRLYRVSKEEIQYVQAYGDYLKIQTRDRQYAPKMTLQELESKLSEPPFLRVHRSWLVNLDQVEYLEGNHLVIDHQKIPVSESAREAVLRQL